MKKLMLLALVALIGFAFSAQAADQLVQFKAGDIAMTVLDSDGVSPLADASIKMLSPEDNAVLAEAVSDRFGKAILALDEGRYLLNISDKTLAVMDVAADADIISCRVVVPAASMLVAGQEAKDGGKESASGAAVAGGATAGGTGSSWIVPAGIVAGAAILIGGAWAIIDHQQPSKTIGRHEETPVEPQQPKHHKKSNPEPNPSAV
jgi:hypothetical protein